jgi:hypothetical protein
MAEHFGSSKRDEAGLAQSPYLAKPKALTGSYVAECLGM